MATVHIKWRDDILEHVKYGEIIEPKTEGEEWTISGAHSSHGFLKKVAEFTKKHPGMFIQLRDYKKTFYCDQDNDCPTFELTYKVESGESSKRKSLYNPRCFTEHQLQTLAERAFRQFLSREGDTRGSDWNGYVTENGKVFMFGGYYEVENHVFKITSYWLESVYPSVG